MALVLAACATPPAAPPEIRMGKIEQIQPTTIESDSHAGVGAVARRPGGRRHRQPDRRGTGRDVAMVVGAIGGTIAGSQVAKRYDRRSPGQQIFVRTTAGVLVEVTQPVNPGLQVGQRVFIQGNGEGARVRAAASVDCAAPASVRSKAGLRAGLFLLAAFRAIAVLRQQHRDGPGAAEFREDDRHHRGDRHREEGAGARPRARPRPPGSRGSRTGSGSASCP